MRVALLTIDPYPSVRVGLSTAALAAAGAQVEATTLLPDPSRVDLDRVLDALDGRRLVIDADVADLARVLRRMMRRGELAGVETAVLPPVEVGFLRRFGITAELADAARVAVSASVRTVGVLKDDSGNLVIDHASLRPWGDAARVWVRTYVDDDCLTDGEIAWLRVERGPSGGVRVSARAAGRLARVKRLDGRALTLACEDAAITSDGVGREQPRRKRIWWDEPEQWRLAVAD